MTREQIAEISVQTNMYFARVLKEHCMFVSAGLNFTGMRVVQSLDRYKMHFEMLLAECVESCTVFVSGRVRTSGEMLTERTLECEIKNSDIQGTSLNHRITSVQKDMLLRPTPRGEQRSAAVLERCISLNTKGRELATGLAETLESLLDGVLSGKMSCHIYPSMLEHAGIECAAYLNELDKVTRGEPDTERDRGDRLMDCCRRTLEHCEFARNMLDPTEAERSGLANDYARCCAAVINTKGGGDGPVVFLSVLKQVKDYFEECLDLHLSGRLRGVMTPLLLDHFLRQTCRYIRILTSDKQAEPSAKKSDARE